MGSFVVVLSAALVVAIGAAAVLHSRPSIIAWGVCCVLVAIVAGTGYAANIFGNGNFPGYAIFIAAPMVATFGIERVWFRLGSAVSRPLTTIVLSVPLGLLAFVFSSFVALIIAVNIGLLEP